MIKKITIENFKCFGTKTTIDFSDLTLISGLNNSGKSTIYQILLLLKQSGYSYPNKMTKTFPSLKLNGNILQLGNPEEVVNDKHKDLAVNIVFDNIYPFKYNAEVSLVYKLNDEYIGEGLKSFFSLYSTNIRYTDIDTNIDDAVEYRFERRNDGAYIKSTSCLSFDYIELKHYLTEYIRKKIDKPTIKNIFSKTVEFDNVKDVTFIDFLPYDISVDISQISNCIDDKYKNLFNLNEFNEFLKEKKVTLEKNGTFRLYFSLGGKKFMLPMIKDLISNGIKVVQPFRGDPKRMYVETEYPNPLLQFSEKTSKKIIYAYENGRKISGTLKEALYYWIPKIIKDISAFNVNILVDGLISETIIESGTDKKIAITNVGFGISQILPLILKVLVTPQYSMCIIDEPEVHLHPALQTRMADFFVEMIRLNKKIIIETHSEYIINKTLYYKIIDQSLDIGLFWVVKKDSNSIIEPIKYDEFGYIANKPDGFLDEGSNIMRLINNERMKKM